MADLVIGGRRTKRRAARAAFATIALAAVVAAGAVFVFRRAVSYPVPDGAVPELPLTAKLDAEHAPRLAFGHATLSYDGAIAVLRVRGGPHAIGAAEGRLLAGGVAAVSKTLAPTISHLVSDGGVFGALTHNLRLRWLLRSLDDGIPGHQLVDTVGLARGVAAGGGGPGYEALVRQQAVLDVGVPAPGSTAAPFRQVGRGLTFVVPVRGTSGDRLVVGRSFGLPGAADGGESAARHLTVSFVHAKSVIPFASVGWPGLVGVVSGINAAGIAVMVDPARTADIDPGRAGQPVALIARDVLENARTLHDAIAVLAHASPLGAAAFVVVDGQSRTWAVVERSPTGTAVHMNPHTPAVSDLLTGKAFARDPENDRARRTLPSAMREARLDELLAKPPADAAAAARVLRDRRGVGGTELPPGHRGAIDDPGAVHVALFDPSAMVLYVCEGPGADGRFRAFDLRHELRGQGSRPAPPPDLPPVRNFDPARDEAVLAARRDLRAGSRAFSAGHTAAAREWVARALARVRDLPAALLLAGRYAAAAGDTAAANRYFRRYLDVGPDDPGARDEVRARLGADLPAAGRAGPGSAGPGSAGPAGAGSGSAGSGSAGSGSAGSGSAGSAGADPAGAAGPR